MHPAHLPPQLEISSFDWQITYADSSEESFHWEMPGGDVFGGWITDTTTTVQLVGEDDSAMWSVMMFIPGTTTGKYNWNNQDIFPDIEIETDFTTFDYFFADSGYTEIIEFGVVGERITGRFSGMFLKRSDLFGTTLHIEGSFDVVRLRDNRIISM